MDFLHWKETDWKDITLVTFSAGISAAFSGYIITAQIVWFAALILNAYYLRRQDELEVYGSWGERKNQFDSWEEQKKQRRGN